MDMDLIKLLTLNYDIRCHGLYQASEGIVTIPSLQFEKYIEKTIWWYLDNQEWMDNITSGEYEKYYDEMYKNR